MQTHIESKLFARCLLAVSVLAGGCTARSDETETGAIEAPGGDRLCRSESATGVTRCPARRVSIAGRTILVRHDAAGQLMELLVRAARIGAGQIGNIHVDPSLIPPHDEHGVAFLRYEEASYALGCWQIETDALCEIRLPADMDATVELGEGAVLPAGALSVEELALTASEQETPLVAMLAANMAAATGVFPDADADRFLSPYLSFGRWSCDLAGPTVGPEGQEIAARPTCRLSPHFVNVPSVEAE